MKKTIRAVALVTSTLAALAVQAQSAQAPVSQHLARNLAAQCANCHGTNGRSVADVPSLAGQSAAVLINKMKDYKDGKQQVWASTGQTSLKAGSTAKDLLEQTGLKLDAGESSWGWFLNGITSPFDSKSYGWDAATNSYWRFYVNGKFADVGAGAYKLNFDLHRAGGLWIWGVIVIVAFTLALLAQILFSSGPIGYDVWAGIFAAQWMKVLTFATIIAVAWHAWIGVRNVWMDYAKLDGLRYVLYMLTLVWLVGCTAWAFQVLWRL